MLHAKGLQLGDPSAGFFSMVAQLSDFLHGFIEISGPVGQLHLVSQASLVIITYGRQHHSIISFTGSTWDVAYWEYSIWSSSL
jgi:hypothetical protein